MNDAQVPPKAAVGPVGNVLHQVNRAIEAFTTAILVFAVVVVLLQVFFRMILGRGGAVRWVWEAIILVNIWLTYLGASVLAKDEKNIALRLHEHLPQRVQLVLQQIVRVIVILTSGLVVSQTVKLVQRQMRSRFVTLPFLTRGHGSLVIVIGFSLIALYATYNLLSSMRRRPHQD